MRQRLPLLQPGSRLLRAPGCRSAFASPSPGPRLPSSRSLCSQIQRFCPEPGHACGARGPGRACQTPAGCRPTPLQAKAGSLVVLPPLPAGPTQALSSFSPPCANPNPWKRAYASKSAIVTPENLRGLRAEVRHRQTQWPRSRASSQLGLRAARSAHATSQSRRPASSSQMRRLSENRSGAYFSYVSTGSAAKPSRWPRSPGVSQLGLTVGGKAHSANSEKSNRLPSL